MSESLERPPRPPLLDENDRPGPPPIMSEEPRRSSKGLSVFIAVFALVAFSGIVWYAYDQGRKTGSEETAPLIRADTAPVRVRPEKPGGLEVPHQDKLIFEKLTEGGGQTEGQVERLLPRPEAPKTPPKPAPEPETNTAAIPPAKAPAPVAPKTVESRPAAQAAPTGSTGAGAPRSLLPPPPVIPPKAVPPAPKQEVAPKPKVAPKPAVALKPAVKPAPPKPAAPTTSTASGASAVKPVPGGRFRIQIAALRDEVAARAAWLRAQRANREELGALTLTVERINVSGKGTFHRVQGGPLDEAAARRICQILDSRKQACIVVRR